MKRTKTNLFASFALAGCLLMTGCLSGGRGWLTFKKSGENASLAASGAEAKIGAEQTREAQRRITESAEEIRKAAREIRKHNDAVVEVIAEDAPEVLSETTPHTGAIQALATETEAKAKKMEDASEDQEKWLTKFKKFAANVVDEAQGKTKWPMSLIILGWLIGIGAALALINSAIPLKTILTPFANVFSAVVGVGISVVSGAFKEEQEMKYEHWDRTPTINNDEMPERIQHKIIKHRTWKAKNGNGKAHAVNPHAENVSEETPTRLTRRRPNSRRRSGRISTTPEETS